VWRTLDRFVVETLERRQDFLDGGDLVLVATAVVGAERQLRDGDCRDADGMAFLLGLAAALDEFERPLAQALATAGRLEAANHVDQCIRVEQVDHSGHSRRSSSGCTRPPRQKSGDNASTPSKNSSHGSRGMTRNPSRVRLRYTSLVSTRNSLGRRIAWLRPLRKTLATVMGVPPGDGIYRMVYSKAPSVKRPGRSIVVWGSSVKRAPP